MPGMDGISLLEIVSERWPETIRIHPGRGLHRPQIRCASRLLYRGIAFDWQMKCKSRARAGGAVHFNSAAMFLYDN
jgi:hypothetical protein